MSQTNSLTFLSDLKSVYSAKGKDALRFLQGMCTADLRRALLSSKEKALIGGTASGYFLNLKGKPLAPAIFCVFSESEILFSLPASHSTSTIEALNKYIVADDVELENQKAWQTFQVFGNENEKPSTPELELLSQIPNALDRVFGVVKINHGLRLPRGLLTPHHEEWWMESPSTPHGKELNANEYLKLRIDAGYPEWGQDIFEDSFLLEFPTKEVISYNKGCYLGQEVVARTTYRGHVTRAFCQFESSEILQEGFIYSQNDLEKPVGKITSALQSKGLGLLRVAHIESREILFQKNNGADPIPLTVSKVLIPYEK
jgi:folate-binding protein YgfZ